MKNKKKKTGFTLMEVLVTVIIIIILSAIALPQYQKAISKSRYVGLMPLARSIKDAEEDYYYREEDYTSELAYLSIQVPGGNPSGSSATINGTTISLTNGDANYVKASKSGLDNTLVLYFTVTSSWKVSQGSMESSMPNTSLR